VPDHREEVDAEFGHVDRDLARGLGGIGVEQRTLVVGDPGQLSDGLQGSGLGVGEHDPDQCRVVGDGLLDVGWVDPAVVVYREGGELEAVGLQAAAGLEHGGVLGGLGDDVIASVSVGAGGAPDSQGVRVGSARGEYDLVDVSAEHVCDLAAGLSDRLPGGLAVVVGARWVAEVLGEVGQRGFDDPWLDRGGGVVVEVDRAVAEPRVTRCRLDSHVRAAPRWTGMPASTRAASANTTCSSGAFMTPFEISQSVLALLDSAPTACSSKFLKKTPVWHACQEKS